MVGAAGPRRSGSTTRQARERRDALPVRAGHPPCSSIEPGRRGRRAHEKGALPAATKRRPRERRGRARRLQRPELGSAARRLASRRRGNAPAPSAAMPNSRAPSRSPRPRRRWPARAPRRWRHVARLLTAGLSRRWSHPSRAPDDTRWRRARRAATPIAARAREGRRTALVHPAQALPRPHQGAIRRHARGDRLLPALPQTSTSRWRSSHPRGGRRVPTDQRGAVWVPSGHLRSTSGGPLRFGDEIEVEGAGSSSVRLGDLRYAGGAGLHPSPPRRTTSPAGYKTGRYTQRPPPIGCARSRAYGSSLAGRRPLTPATATTPPGTRPRFSSARATCSLSMIGAGARRESSPMPSRPAPRRWSSSRAR